MDVLPTRLSCWRRHAMSLTHPSPSTGRSPRATSGGTGPRPTSTAESKGVFGPASEAIVDERVRALMFYVTCASNEVGLKEREKNV